MINSNFCQILSGVFICIYPTTENKWRRDVLMCIFLFWLDFYEQRLKHSYLCFVGQCLIQLYVYFRLGQQLTHRICYFFLYFLFRAVLDPLYFAMEKLTLLLIPFKCLNSLFSVSMPWDLH